MKTYQTNGWQRIDQQIEFSKNQENSGFVFNVQEIEIPQDITPFAKTSQYFRGPTPTDLIESIQEYLDECHPEWNAAYDWVTDNDLQIQIYIR